jgi:hypothetical protein
VLIGYVMYYCQLFHRAAQAAEAIRRQEKVRPVLIQPVCHAPLKPPYKQEGVARLRKKYHRGNIRCEYELRVVSPVKQEVEMHFRMFTHKDEQGLIGKVAYALQPAFQ